MQTKIIESKVHCTVPIQGKLYTDGNDNSTVFLFTNERFMVVIHSDTYGEGYSFSEDDIQNPVLFRGTLQLTQD